MVITCPKPTYFSYTAPHVEQRIGDLPKRAAAHCVHQHFEHVLIGDHGLLQALEHRAGLVLVARLEVAQALEL